MLLTLTLIGCGEEPVYVGDTNVSESTQCAQRIGAYKVVWTESSGDCGPLPDQIITGTSQPNSFADVDPLCSGTFDYSQNNYKVVVDGICPGANGYEFISRGTANWSQDASQGSATNQLIILDAYSGFVLCSSIYEITYNRI